MPTPSIAVLPFTDASPDSDQQHFCDGLATELIGALSRIDGLRVAPRSSSFRFRDTEDVPGAGRQLGVTAVLEGTVSKANNRLSVSARLTSANDGFELWSESFDRDLEDVFEIQHQIAQSITRTLRLRLDEQQAAALRRPPTTDLQAYDYYLRGRQRFFEYRRRSVEDALQLFNMAITLDHDYARAYAGITECCTFLHMYAGGDKEDLEQADIASRRALELAPHLAEAHTARGLVLSLQHEYSAAEEEFETALRLNPKLFEAYYFYARNAFAQGDLETAAKLWGHASTVNQDDYQSPLLVAQVYDDLERPAEATAARRRGILAVERRLAQDSEETRALYMGANALVCLGERVRGLEWADKALELEPEEPMLLYNVACVYALAGRIEEAIDCAERSIEGGVAYVEWMRQDSNLDALRGHPRFEALLATGD